MTTSRQVLNIGGIILIIAALAPFGATIAPQVVGADHSYVILSGSMEPSLTPGDVVIIRDVPTDEIDVGDVITFDRDPTRDVDRVTHRVIDIVERQNKVFFKTKGDANDQPDQGLIPAEAVAGRVLYTIPWIGHVILFAQTKEGIAALVIVPGVLLMMSEAWTLANAVIVRPDEAPDSEDGQEAETQGEATGENPSETGHLEDHPQE